MPGGRVGVHGGRRSREGHHAGLRCRGHAVPFNVAAAKGFEAAAKAAGVKTIVLDAKTSVERQGNAVDDLIAQKVDGIAVLPIDAVVAQSWVDRAASHNIPFVAVATQIGDPQKHAIKDVYPKLSALVASDEVHAGYDAAQIAATLLPKGRTANIAIVEGAPGYPTVWQVTQGFKEGLDKAGIKYQHRRLAADRLDAGERRVRLPEYADCTPGH